jgi:hypothetical protein
MRNKLNPETPLPRSGTAQLARQACMLGLALATMGCAPALDWRFVDVPDSELEVQLPCRPGRFERDLRVAGVPLKLFMLSCEAGGVTYGVATADVGDPASVEIVLAALAENARAALRAAGESYAPLELPGATPFRGNVKARLHGRRPDGRPAEESFRVFARGSRIFQASAIGSSFNDAAVKPFEEGLRFDLEKRPANPG